MLETQEIIDEIGDEVEWDIEKKYELLLQYIENQEDPESFRDFLEEIVREEYDG